MTPPTMPKAVSDAFASYPDGPREQLLAIRRLIFDEAAARDVGPLTETLKWGEPAYLTEESKAGTTLRLTWKAKAPEIAQMLVHCSTDLVDRWRGQFAELAFDGNRALNLGPGSLPEPQLRMMIGQALTYHRP